VARANFHANSKEESLNAMPNVVGVMPTEALARRPSGARRLTARPGCRLKRTPPIRLDATPCLVVHRPGACRAPASVRTGIRRDRCAVGHAPEVLHAT
jgi:hypothetical protein